MSASLYVSGTETAIQFTQSSPPHKKSIENQVQDFAHYMCGILATDTQNSALLPQQFLNTGSSYQPASIDRLRDFVSAKFDAFKSIINHPHPAIIKLGVLYACNYDIKRITQWSAEFLKYYPHARKKDQPPHEIQTLNDWHRLLAKQPHHPQAKKIRAALAEIDIAESSRYYCEKILRAIGSYGALRAAQHVEQLLRSQCTCQNHNTVHEKVSREARAWYNQLVLEEYQAASMLTQIPLVLQHKIEEFVYSPAEVMRQLHTFTLNSNLTTPQYNHFLVGKEHFKGINTSSTLFGSTTLYGCSAGDISDTLSKYVREKSNYLGVIQNQKVASVEGNPDRYCIRIVLENQHTMLVSAKSLNEHITNLNLFHRVMAPCHFQSMNSTHNTACYLLNENRVVYSTGVDFFGWTVKYRFDVMHFNDKGNLFFAAARNTDVDDNSPITQLITGSFINTTEKDAPQPTMNINYISEDLSFQLTEPVIASSHTGQFCALGGKTKEGASKLAIVNRRYELTQHHWVDIPPVRALKQITFSADDTHVFVKAERYQEDTKSQCADRYFMIDISRELHDNSLKTLAKRKLVKCTMPYPTEPYTTLKTAIDPLGEYIGTYARTDKNNMHKVIPTDYHLKHHLIPTFQRFSCKDRIALYLLHTALQQPPDFIHISPEQWRDIFSKLELEPHIMLRFATRLTSRDGTMLHGLSFGSRKVPIATSLNTVDALAAACRLSGQRLR
jgi:hypothetical protein